MKVLVFGNGWLGNKIADHLDGRVSKNDILDTEAVMSELLDYRPDVVVNAAGKCGRPNIDWCEKTDNNKRLTTYVNTFGPAILYRTVSAVSEHLYAQSTGQSSGSNMKFVHLSSGCLWEWGENLSEDEVPIPPSHYSKTKAEGERRLPLRQTLILRLRMPVGKEPDPRNLITKLAGYKSVIDVPNSVTIIDDFLDVLVKLIEKDARGVYNVVNPEPITATEIMTWYKEIVDPSHEFITCDMDKLRQDLLISAGRSNVSLSTHKLMTEYQIRLPGAKERIKECLREYKKLLHTPPISQ